MTNGEVKQSFRKHRTAAIAGGVAGLLLIGGWFGYDMAVTPSQPDLTTARASEIVSYIASDRGLGRLTQIEQQQFLDQWKAHLQQEGRDAELKTCMDELGDEERKAFTAVVIRQSKRAFVDDAKRYAQQRTPADKDKFIRERLAQYAAQAEFTKRVAASFKGDAPKSQDELHKWIMQNTTAEERAIGEPYFEALKRVREIVRKEERGAQSASAGPTGA